MTDRDRSGHEPRDGEPEAVDITPIDPDVALLERWLARDLAPDEARAVKQRLIDDPAFFDKAAPIIRIWTMPVRFGARLERPHRAASESRQVAPPAPQTAVTRPRASRGRPELITPRHGRRARFVTTLKTTLKRRTVAMLKYGPPILAVATMSLWLTVRYVETGRDRQSVELDRAPHAKVPNGTSVESGSAETRTIELRGGARAVVRHDSKFTYSYAARTRSMMAALDGEVALDLTKEQAFLLLQTSAGDVLLTPGSYAVRCEPGCAAVLVTVGAGMARLQGDSGTARLSIAPGEHGRIPKRGAPEKVIGGDKWPALEPPATPPGPPTGAAPRGAAASSPARGRTK